MRLTFRAKLTVIVLISAGALLLVTIASAILAARVERQVATVQDLYLPKIELGPQLEGDFDHLRRGFQDAVAAGDMESLAATRVPLAAFSDRLRRTGVVDPAIGGALNDAVHDYYDTAYDVSRRLIAGETGEGLVDAMAAMQGKQFQVERLVSKATAVDRKEMAAAFASVSKVERTASNYRVWITVGCLTAVVILSAGLGRSVVRVLRDLSEGFFRFGQGDFRLPIPVHAADEFGDLATRANQMARDLEGLEEQRKKAEDRFRSILEAAPDAMVIAGEDGRITYVNTQAQRLFGYERGELVGQKVELLLPTRYRESHPANRAAYFGAPKVRSMGSGLDLFGLRKDGAEFPVEISLSPLATDRGLLVCSAIRDVTARRAIETALKNSNRELEAFSYSVAHDLRAPLRGIHGFSHALLEDSADKLDDEGKDQLNRISAAAGRMGLLIDALLALSRVSRVELRRETVNMTRAAEGVMSQLRASQPERKVEFDNQPDVVAHGDPALLRAILDNLLGNAWKFTAARPTAHIAFGTVPHAGGIAYCVRDDGAGFDMAYAGKLFVPFQRLHQATEFAGTGIGLATVQRIVLRHGGSIWAEGAVGRGATFHFTLAPIGKGTNS
jgi:PAS domain S-box-containing protein